MEKLVLAIAFMCGVASVQAVLPSFVAGERMSLGKSSGVAYFYATCEQLPEANSAIAFNYSKNKALVVERKSIENERYLKQQISKKQNVTILLVHPEKSKSCVVDVLFKNAALQQPAITEVVVYGTLENLSPALLECVKKFFVAKMSNLSRVLGGVGIAAALTAGVVYQDDLSYGLHSIRRGGRGCSSEEKREIAAAVIQEFERVDAMSRAAQASVSQPSQFVNAYAFGSLYEALRDVRLNETYTDCEFMIPRILVIGSEMLERKEPDDNELVFTGFQQHIEARRDRVLVFVIGDDAGALQDSPAFPLRLHSSEMQALFAWQGPRLDGLLGARDCSKSVPFVTLDGLRKTPCGHYIRKVYSSFRGVVEPSALNSVIRRPHSFLCANVMLAHDVYAYLAGNENAPHNRVPCAWKKETAFKHKFLGGPAEEV